jgi:osmotically-inducible protein OsmY
MGRMSFLAGAAFGAGMMYFFDPDRGNRRRALVRDQIVSMRHDAEDTATGMAKDKRNRAMGLLAETAARLREKEVPDYVLTERVRSEMGRATSHPRAIDVQVDEGMVKLRGTILKAEVDRLISTVTAVRGVKGVESYLEEHDTPGDIPSLQTH